MISLIKKKISIEDMLLFEMLTTTGSISGVASRTGLTQPAVTQKLNRLERQIGSSLWIRRGRSLGEPSEAGNRFLNYSKTVLRETMDLFTDLGVLTRDRIIHIGSSSIPSEHFVPKLIAAFRSRKCSEEMRLSLAGSRKICMLVENGSIDAGFTGFIVPGYSGKSHIIAEDMIVPVISPESEIARSGRKILLEDLAKMPFIMRESDSGTRSILEEVLSDRGFNLPERSESIEVAGTHALLQSVREGIGYSFVSNFNTADLHILEIEDLPKITRNFYLLFRRDSVLDKKTDQFINFAIEYFSSNSKAGISNV